MRLDLVEVCQVVNNAQCDQVEVKEDVCYRGQSVYLKEEIFLAEEDHQTVKN